MSRIPTQATQFGEVWNFQRDNAKALREQDAMGLAYDLGNFQKPSKAHLRRLGRKRDAVVAATPRANNRIGDPTIEIHQFVTQLQLEMRALHRPNKILRP